MSENEIKPVATANWKDGRLVHVLDCSPNEEGVRRLYDQSAIDRLTAELSLASGDRNRLQLKWDAFRQAKNSEVQLLAAERDVLRIEKERLQEIRQRLESERDAALESRDRYWDERDEAQRKLSVAVASGNALVAQQDVTSTELARVKASIGAIHYAIRAGFSQETILAECMNAAPELAAIDAARAEGGV